MKTVKVTNPHYVELRKLPVFSLFTFPDSNSVKVKLDVECNCIFLEEMNHGEKLEIYKHSGDVCIIPVKLIEVHYEEVVK